MCGIAAALGHVDRETVEAVRRMNAAMTHRGPDDEGVWSDEPGVVLAQRRLSIIDLSADGHQPMLDPDTGAAIVYNGETYNYRELRADLEAGGARFHSASDTEVVLRAHMAWGDACLERLRGMFALALWDPRRRALFIARDRLGIKPLYYYSAERGNGRRTLLIASELRALLASELVPRRLCATALATYVWNGFVNGPDAIIEGVRCLAPGHFAVIPADRPEVAERRWWQLPHDENPSPDLGELEKELGEAVRLRLVSDVPLGVFLSGGVDSSAVAALAARGSGNEVRTFNIGFEEPEYDETREAVAVAEALGTQHTTIALPAEQFRAGLPDALGSLDQPSFDQLNTYFVSRAVREAGLTVALSGLGGDELFGGYTSFADLPRAQAWSRRVARLPGPLRRAVSAAAGLSGRARGAPVGSQVRWAKLADVFETRGRLVELYQVSYALFTRAFTAELLPQDLRRRAPHGLTETRARELELLLQGSSTLQGISLLELSCFVGERLLRDSDAASMAVSLELRVPLLDHRVIECLARLADARRFEPVGRKSLLREVALQGVDPQIFDRPKSGFVLPIQQWARAALREEVGSTLLDVDLCRSIGLEPDAVARLWRAFEAGAPGIYWSRVWALFVLLWWCRRHSVVGPGSA